MASHRKTAALLLLTASLLGACKGGEDRPGQITTENADATGEVTGSGGGTASGSGSGTGSPSTGSGSGAATTEMHHDTTTTAFAESAATATMNIRLKDFEFVDVPASVKGTRVLVKALNTGPAAHEVEIVGEEGDVGEIGALPRGEEGSMSLALEPGTYTMQCLIETAEGKTHAELGMRTTFVVTG